ncbi:surface antigen-like protein [Flavobacterium croceum DSM 17960]|uniref:Surface antigen-like protein n=2 Tax=Flavobacterium TaxID=237 RepID=A0A2S4NA96_9FLAO|nr:BamA/TamA family outer membrane protein [Flavobacterium croceum]POS02608.1 surface antigen-like protein [Flavobacterium croceum DSM 17960]
MKNRITKIALYLVTLLIVSCNITKRVPNGKRLLSESDILVNNKISKDEEAYYQLYQKRNSSILGYKLRLNLYNLATPKKDSLYEAWLTKNPKTHQFLTSFLSDKQVNRLGKSFVVSGMGNFLRGIGEPPVILDSTSTKKSLKRLESFYFNKGYFDVKNHFVVDTSKAKQAFLKYYIELGNPYSVDSLYSKIDSPVLDSLYQKGLKQTVLKTNKQYSTEDLNYERTRITSHFRNNGAYLFQSNYITYDIDTIGKKYKTSVGTLIKNFNYYENDTLKQAPFKLYKINRVNIYTDHSNNKTENFIIKDSTQYSDFYLYSQKKLKYRPKSITDAIFITKGSMFSDENTSLTSRYLSNLRVFNYPTIIYKPDPKDSNGLISEIYLVPRKKYTLNTSADFTHSNIQDFGISGNSSVSIRNVFNGTETFEIGLRGTIATSKQLANPDNRFFNISEIGIDAKLNFPRIFFPIKTNKIIPKSMIPSTTLSVGFAKQTNIGLDKQNLTSSFSYNWKPSSKTTAKFDLFNIQFVKNLNIGNYFNIYKSSYTTLNNLALAYNANTNYFYTNPDTNLPELIIEDGVGGFIYDALVQPNNLGNPFISLEDYKTVLSILERYNRLTEDNLIFASTFSYNRTTQENTGDKNFHSYKFKVESAGNFLALIARMSKQLKTQEGAGTFFEVQYSQYVKGEFEFIKHWDLFGKNVLATRMFAGMAIPYGNSKTVPFSRSYFSGGSNDNRAWQPYSLGPGSSGSIFDFNEANMKIALNAELRFPMFGKFNGAIFADAGNIWNFLDATTEKSFLFKGINSLDEFALGTGFGLRYDQGLFVVRADLGFKTYNPALEVNHRWFKQINLNESVINIGINYPF